MPNWNNNNVMLVARNEAARNLMQELLSLYEKGECDNLCEWLRPSPEKEREEKLMDLFPMPEHKDLYQVSWGDARWCSGDLREHKDKIKELGLPWNIDFTGDAAEINKEILGGCESCYDWNNHNWGTKWGQSDWRLEVDGDTYNISGESAWCPWLEAMDFFLENNPEADFYVEYWYADEGFHPVGRCEWSSQGGKTIGKNTYCDGIEQANLLWGKDEHPLLPEYEEWYENTKENDEAFYEGDFSKIKTGDLIVDKDFSGVSFAAIVVLDEDNYDSHSIVGYVLCRGEKYFIHKHLYEDTFYLSEY